MEKDKKGLLKLKRGLSKDLIELINAICVTSRLMGYSLDVYSETNSNGLVVELEIKSNNKSISLTFFKKKHTIKRLERRNYESWSIIHRFLCKSIVSNNQKEIRKTLKIILLHL